MDKLYIIIPAYNEEANIRNVIDEWYPVVEAHSGNGESRLVVIDDGSKDDTYKIISEEAKTRPLLQAETKPNGGHGATVLHGYKYALECRRDYIFQTGFRRHRLCRRSLNSSGIREENDHGYRLEKQASGRFFPGIRHQNFKTRHKAEIRR